VTKQLDLLDIQGHVLRAYGRFHYPVARYIFLNIKDESIGRDFVGAISKKVTTAVEWGNGPGQVEQPPWTVNIALTYQGLKQLGIPRSSLIGFSPEFVSGMKERKDILGDDGPARLNIGIRYGAKTVKPAKRMCISLSHSMHSSRKTPIYSGKVTTGCWALSKSIKKV